jgi:hypothetical protein
MFVQAQGQYSRRHDDREIGWMKPLEIVVLRMFDA